jgi:hypothetical protein
MRGLLQRLDVPVVKRLEQFEEQEEKNLSRQFNQQAPPFDSQKSHGSLPPS